MMTNTFTGLCVCAMFVRVYVCIDARNWGSNNHYFHNTMCACDRKHARCRNHCIFIGLASSARLDRELRKNDIFVREKDTNGIPCNMFPHRQKRRCTERKKNRQQHNKLKTKQSNRINVTQNIYVASFLLN